MQYSASDVPHRQKKPGRHCAICGKPGGSGFTVALNMLGYPGRDLKAHADCLAKKRRSTKTTQK